MSQRTSFPKLGLPQQSAAEQRIFYLVEIAQVRTDADETEVDKDELEVRMTNLISPCASKRASQSVARLQDTGAVEIQIVEKPILFLNESLREVRHPQTKELRVNANLNTGPALIG